jgi:integrase
VDRFELKSLAVIVRAGTPRTGYFGYIGYMPRKTDGSGSIYKRGDIWWVKIRVDGRPVYQSSKSQKKADAINLRDKLLAQKHRGEISGGAPDRIAISELLDDLIKCGKFKPATLYIWKKVIEKNVRPYFGKLKATRLSTDLMDKYRKKRKDDGVSDTTVNRELALIRMAYNLGRKRTPPKVNVVPYFPMVQETNIRTGFMADEQYDKLRDELSPELRLLFVVSYVTGVRRGELLPIQWDQVDFDAALITLERNETKNKTARTVPILDGDMHNLLKAAKRERDAGWPSSPWVFNRCGERIKDFRHGWEGACKRAGVPDLNFHDLRRTAVRNMRRAGVPQVVRMKISGHKTDSMERRYNITDADDINIARELMQKRIKSVTKTVTTRGKQGKPGDTAPAKKTRKTR